MMNDEFEGKRVTKRLEPIGILLKDERRVLFDHILDERSMRRGHGGREEKSLTLIDGRKMRTNPLNKVTLFSEKSICFVQNKVFETIEGESGTIFKMIDETSGS